MVGVVDKSQKYVIIIAKEGSMTPMIDLAELGTQVTLICDQAIKLALTTVVFVVVVAMLAVIVTGVVQAFRN